MKTLILIFYFIMANIFHIKRAEYVEVAVPQGNTKTQIYFPDLPNLRTSKVFGMEAYSANTHTYSFSGALTADTQDLINSVTTLYFEGGEFIQIPTLSLFRLNGFSYYGDIPMLSGQVIVWAKSYITLTNTSNLGNYAGKSYVFNVYYSPNNI